MIRLATSADAPALSAFAREIFMETFGPANDPAHIDPYVAKAFTAEVQREEIEREGAFTVLVLDESSDGAGGEGGDAAIIGYAFVALGAPATVEVGSDPIEIKRFYVASKEHGRGLAKALMQDVFDRSRAAGARTIWLGVWERNARAIAFYQKQGFVQAGTQRFLLGDDLQTDWVMQNERALR